MGTERTDRTPLRTWRSVAALASVGAAGVHFGAVRAHLDEFAPAGAFMLAAGALQLVWAGWVARGASRAVLEAGGAVNAAIVMLWIASRTTGLPVGPMPGVAEHIHGPDVLATGLEVLIVVAVLAMTAHVRARPPRSALVLALAGALATVVVGGDYPVHERSVAAATLALALAASRVVPVLIEAVSNRPRRRSHVTFSHARVPAAGFAAAARAGGGAGG